MSFNPLGSFDAAAPLNPKIVAAAHALVAQLADVPAGGLWRCYLHWAVAPFGCTFEDYNVMANYVAGEWELEITNSPANNAPGLTAAAEASHTYMRNTGAVGIAIAGMDGATTTNFGPDGVTVAGIEYLCAGAAALCAKYGIDASGTSTKSPYANEHNILTHAEAGDAVGSPAQYSAYGPAGDVERWDLASLVPVPSGVTLVSIYHQVGDALRARVHAYKIALG